MARIAKTARFHRSTAVAIWAKCSLALACALASASAFAQMFPIEEGMRPVQSSESAGRGQMADKAMQQRAAAEAKWLAQRRRAAEARRQFVAEYEFREKQFADAMQFFLKGNSTARQEPVMLSGQGNSFASLMRAHAMRWGFSNIPVDVVQADDYQRKAKRKATSVLSWVDRLADKGNEFAIIWKAIHLDESSLPADQEAAFKLYRAVADRFGYAAFRLGRMYDKGRYGLSALSIAVTANTAG